MKIFTCVILQTVPQSGGGYGGIILLLALAILFIIVIKYCNSEKSKRNHKQDAGNNTKQQQSFSYYVEDDGTIVRGEDEYGARNAKNSIIVLKTIEQKEAISLIQESANEGVAEAQYYLGVLYEQGKVVPKDIELAKKWFNLAAEQNNPQAKFHLGKLILDENN